jgi:uncharacterized protein DUF5132
MGLFDATKGWGGGVLIGVGAAIAAPVIIPATAAVVRPLAKGLIWGVLAAADKLKETVAETREQVNDLVAEVRSEYADGAGTTSNRKSRSLSA